MIKFNDVQIKYGDYVAIDNLNLEINEGEFFTMLGLSGCGKTTTLRSLVGFSYPTKGKIFIDETDVTKMPTEKRDVSIVFQSYALFPTMTVYENIAFGLTLQKLPKEYIDKKVREVADKVQIIPEKLFNNVSELSGGQQQRVAIARALVLNPKILCLDEPLSNLDAKLRVELRNELKKLQRDLKITTIYVTHDQEEALTLSDRIAVFNKGKIEQIGTPQEIYRVRDILRNKERNHVDFKLNRSIYDDFTNMGEYKRNFRVNLMLQRNEARYKMTGDYWDSLEEIKAGVFYSQNRFGIGYEVDENADWRDKKGVKEWGKVDREHKISLVTKIGKPSEGWTLKTYAKFYEDLTGKIKQSSDERARKSSLDGLGIEIGKEMGYYQWSVAFEKEYVLSARDYEWRAALQFTLLTFPSNPIFGIGADTDVNKKIKPETYMFDGLKVEDIID